MARTALLKRKKKKKNNNLAVQFVKQEEKDTSLTQDKERVHEVGIGSERVPFFPFNSVSQLIT